MVGRKGRCLAGCIRGELHPVRGIASFRPAAAIRTTMPRKVLLSLCAVLVCAAPALAAGTENRFRDLRGTVSSVSSASIAVTHGDRTLTCAIDDRSPSVGQVGTGDRVLVRCRRVRTDFVLQAAQGPRPARPRQARRDRSRRQRHSARRRHHHGRERQEGSRAEVHGPGPLRRSSWPSSRSASVWRCGAAAPRGLSRSSRRSPCFLSRTQVVTPGCWRRFAVSSRTPGQGKVAVTNADGPRTLSCRVPAALAAAVATLTIGDPVLMSLPRGRARHDQEDRCAGTASEPNTASLAPGTSPTPPPHQRRHRPQPNTATATVAPPAPPRPAQHRHRNPSLHQHRPRAQHRHRNPSLRRHRLRAQHRHRRLSAARLRMRVWVCRFRPGPISGR